MLSQPMRPSLMRNVAMSEAGMVGTTPQVSVSPKVPMIFIIAEQDTKSTASRQHCCWRCTL